MSVHPVNKAVSYAGQALGYTAFCAALAYFSTSPVYRHLPPDGALVKLSLQHAGQRKEPCRERSAEELAKLAPNMRVATVCGRERVPVAVEIALDGKPLVSAVVPPSGLSKDGSSTLYRRANVTAGSHTVVAKLKDAPTGDFNYVKEITIDLKPGAILLLDFDAKAGGWVFRS